MCPNTPGFPSPSLPRSWLAQQGCVIGSPCLIWCFIHFQSHSLQSAPSLCNTSVYPGVCWGKPFSWCTRLFPPYPHLPYQIWNQPSVCQKSRLFISLNSILWLIFGVFWCIIDQCTTLVPAAQRCLARYAGWIHSWSFMISFDAFHMEHEGLIISFIS